MLTLKQEELLFKWTVIWTAVVFLSAAKWQDYMPGEDGAVTVGNNTNGDTKPHPGNVNASVIAYMKRQKRKHQFIQDTVFKQVFLKLGDEYEQFWSEATAKMILPGQINKKRKPNCGGWPHIVSTLALRRMGVRCPPLSLL